MPHPLMTLSTSQSRGDPRTLTSLKSHLRVLTAGCPVGGNLLKTRLSGNAMMRGFTFMGLFEDVHKDGAGIR